MPLFHLLAAMSLLLCVATVAVWIRSHWVRDRIGYDGRTFVAGINVSLGNFVGYVYRGDIVTLTSSRTGWVWDCLVPNDLRGLKPVTGRVVYPTVLWRFYHHH